MSSEQIRVLHIAEAFDPGGVVWWLIDVTRELAPANVRADFLSLGGRGVRAGEVEATGSDVTPFSVTPSELAFGSRIREAIDRGGYDIVHSHIFNLSGWLLRHADGRDVPVRIAHFHTTQDGRPDSIPTRLRRRLSRSLISRHANVALGCTHSALEMAPSLRSELLRGVVPYGIDASVFSAGPTGRLREGLGLAARVPLVGHVGRFTEPKNHRGLIEIFETVLKSVPDAHLALIGDGDLFEEVSELVSDKGLADRVHILGARTDVSALLADMDVFAFPSWWEGLGIVLLEARMAGIPVVASDLPSIREALTGAEGYVLEDPADPSAFAAAIIRALDGSNQLPPPAEWVHSSSKEASAERLLDIYRLALSRVEAA